MNPNNETDQEISDDDSKGTAESTLSFDIKEDDLDNQQEVIPLGQARRDKSLRTTRVP